MGSGVLGEGVGFGNFWVIGEVVVFGRVGFREVVFGWVGSGVVWGRVVVQVRVGVVSGSVTILRSGMVGSKRVVFGSSKVRAWPPVVDVV